MRKIAVIPHTGGRLTGSHLSPESLASFRAKHRSHSIQTFWTRVKITPTCWLWTGSVGSRGYGVFAFDGQTTSHRASWAIEHGAIPPGVLVLHHCDVKLCVRPSHLYLGSHSDNIRDAHARHRRPLPPWAGQRPPATKLTDADVTAIRDFLAHGLTGRELAGMFNVSPTAISRIKRGRTWCGR